MSLVTLSNLYPRPDRPQLGMFNARLFSAMAETLEPEGGLSRRMLNICLVPEWRLWRWAAVRTWRDPFDAALPTVYEPVFYLPAAGRDLAPRLYALSGHRLARHLRERRHLYASWLYPDGVLAAGLAARLGLTAWNMVLGSDARHAEAPARRRQLRRAASHTAGYVCVSRALVESMASLGIPRDKLHHVPNGVDTRHFRYRTQAEALQGLHARGAPFPPHPGERLVLFVGNLVDVKDPGLALEAFLGAARAIPSGSGGRLRLVMLGEGPLRPVLEAQTEAGGVDDLVMLLGARPAEEIALWMSAAELLVLSSRSEGMPNVVLEALACGLPVVATDVGACREMCAGEAACAIVPAGDAAALGAAIAAGLDRPVDRKALSARHGHYRWHDMAKRILDVMGVR